MVDPDSKLLVLTTPKGGATVTAHLVFEYLNLTEKALSFSPWIHDYRTRVYDQFYKHEDVCRACKRGSEWTCLFIIRSPADRVVSSFIHVLHDDKLRPGKDPSFFDYVQKLLDLRRDETLRFPDGHHVAPQNYDCLENIHYVALEFLDEGLRAFSDATGRRFGRKTNTSSFTSPHYVTKKHCSLDLSQTPFSLLPQEAFPAYDSFLENPDLNEALFCCIFDDDIAIYRHACAQSWLMQRCPTCQARCNQEINRLDALVQSCRSVVL